MLLKHRIPAKVGSKELLAYLAQFVAVFLGLSAQYSKRDGKTRIALIHSGLLRAVFDRFLRKEVTTGQPSGGESNGKSQQACTPPAPRTHKKQESLYHGNFPIDEGTLDL